MVAFFVPGLVVSYRLLQFFENLEPSLIGMEAFGSGHHWAHRFQKLGHEIRLMPAMYVKAYVKRGKSDAIDAEATCEAVMCRTMRFVAIKTEKQQGGLFLYRARDLVVGHTISKMPCYAGAIHTRHLSKF